MAILPLIIAPDPILNQPSNLVTKFDSELRKLANDMIETMYANNGIGLAAVQVGIHQKLIVVDVEYGSPRYQNSIDSTETMPKNPQIFVNPEIIEHSTNTVPYEEGCLSFPNQYSEVIRPEQVTIKYHDITGKLQTITATGLMATCLQHEIDHTNGITFVDHISKLKRDMILRKLRKAKKQGLFNNCNDENCNHEHHL